MGNLNHTSVLRCLCCQRSRRVVQQLVMYMDAGGEFRLLPKTKKLSFPSLEKRSAQDTQEPLEPKRQKFSPTQKHQLSLPKPEKRLVRDDAQLSLDPSKRQKLMAQEEQSLILRVPKPPAVGPAAVQTLTHKPCA